MGRPYSILCCSTAFLPAEAHGGLPYSTFNLCKALIRAGADVRVVTSDRNGAHRLNVATDEWTTYDGLPVWYAKTRAGPYLYAATTRTAIAEAMPRIDCVINSGTLWVHSGWVAWRYARRHRKPSLTYVRGLLQPWAFQYKAGRKQLYWHLIGKRILRDAAAIVALTEQEKATIRTLGVTGRIEVVPNGAALDGDGGDRNGRVALDAAHPELAGRRYVLFLGRIHAVKGMELLVPAIARLMGEIDRLAFVIAGPMDPAYEPRWNDLVRAHGLGGRLILPGAVSGHVKAAWFQHADAFVLASHGEGMPVAVLEALHSGCPVVITRGCNVPEVSDAGAGIVTEPDSRALADALRTLLTDEPLRRGMAERAHHLARATFDWTAIGERTLALCRELSRSRS